MTNRYYSVVMDGTVRDGSDREDVAKNLSILFKKNPTTLRKLLSGTPRAVKKTDDPDKALQFMKIVRNAGAGCRVELIEEEDTGSAAPSSEPEQVPGAEGYDPGIFCPRCGYKPKNEDDVLLVRGDCPKCGLLAAPPPDVAAGVLGIGAAGGRVGATDDEEDEFEEERPGKVDLYGGETPAPWSRRRIAALQTCGMFLFLYLLIFMLLSFTFYAPSTVFKRSTVEFVKSSLSTLPLLTAALSVVVVCVLIPVYNKGLTYGQKLAGVGQLYTEEAQAAGLWLSLGFRAGTALLITLAPALTVRWILMKFGLLESSTAAGLLVIALAALSWVAAGWFAYTRPDMRGLLDLSAGTVQIEEGIEPTGAGRRAIKPYFGVAAILLSFGVVFPLLSRLFTR
ncbi:MAG: hypothetical protein V2B18_12170 [Pseudomonadota bacterium]